MFRASTGCRISAAFKPHVGRTIQVWNVTLICLLMVGFLAQTSVEYSRAWIVLFYATTLVGLVVLALLHRARHRGCARRRTDFGAAHLPDRHRRQRQRLRQPLRAVDARHQHRRLPLPDPGCRHRVRRGAARHARSRSRRSRRQRAQPRARCHLPVAAVVGDRDDRALRRDLPDAAGRDSPRPRADPAQIRRGQALETRPDDEPAADAPAVVALRRSRRSGRSTWSLAAVALIVLTPLLVLVAATHKSRQPRARYSSCSAATASISSRSASSNSAPCARSTTAR